MELFWVLWKIRERNINKFEILVGKSSSIEWKVLKALQDPNILGEYFVIIKDELNKYCSLKEGVNDR